MNSISELQQLIKVGTSDWEAYGDVRAAYHNSLPLVMFSYTSAAQFSGRWNWFERVSRGLILNAKTGEVVARPFDKFFNWGERRQYSNGHIVTVTEKIDGSLGILYRDGVLPSVATRGSFESEQAIWATEHLRMFYDLNHLPDEYTLLFEIVYPGNRIVVDYESTEDLFLLAVRNRYTGEYLPFFPDVYNLAEDYGFPLPRIFSFNSVTDIIAATDTLPGSEEGWVVEFSDGQRFKFKGDRYLELHRLVTNTSFKRMLSWVADGSYTALLADVPDELLDQIRAWKEEIDTKVAAVTCRIEDAYENAPKDDRKTFALWAKAQHPDLVSYLFRRLDGQEYTSLIYRAEF